MTEPVAVLSDDLYGALNEQPFVLLHTIDAETGAPTSNAISWIYAVDRATLRFALDGRSRLTVNMTSTAEASVTLFAPGTVQTIHGTARLVAEALEDVPFKLVCFDLDIASIRDAMFYGARLSVRPEHEKTYDKRAADKLDGQVFAAMKKA
ncbi:Pyridoxamine 5'-phosphate oxidase [Paenibacillus sp. UNC496MF]|uniref:pyridoxamine 5'-phosphate oxidase family protein n=1 Tax=Paenibacillus sp. UNC496MF TaxID=1502753 RepID=UPI0008E655BB|nr:pyridoxamine 5'-phosphate oxidase family protein [Paenibacillus sp. UNC496MF]SFI60786.1 Pyridoxamine 5'-phosphate oxidase [Paenibacillus sp. UNC496MF]